jgi:hypothetical protein
MMLVSAWTKSLGTDGNEGNEGEKELGKKPIFTNPLQARPHPLDRTRLLISVD